MRNTHGFYAAVFCGCAVILFSAPFASGQVTTGEVTQQPPQPVDPKPAAPNAGNQPPSAKSGVRIPLISAKRMTPSQLDKENEKRPGPQIPKDEQLKIDPNQNAKLPYQDLIKIAQSDASQPKDAKIYTLQISSTRAGVKPSEIELFIDTPDVPMVLPVSEEGYFQVPYSIDMYEQNPHLVANQPKGSLNISVKLALPKVDPPKIVDGKVRYQELFRPLLEMAKAMAKVDQSFGKAGNQQFALEIITGTEPIHVNRALGQRTISPNTDGKIYMIYERLLFEENPEISVPLKTTVNVRPVSPREAALIRAQ
ncbi:MAG: hypothetical protein HKN23_10020 [Verrucomicrobiales bacterium]|nr:hypothetical protein [Verrucomicrobiales bacterium]